MNEPLTDEIDGRRPIALLVGCGAGVQPVVTLVHPADCQDAHDSVPRPRDIADRKPETGEGKALFNDALNTFYLVIWR